MKCLNGKGNFTGNEVSPKGFGYCAKNEAIGTERMGTDGNMWIIKTYGTKNFKKWFLKDTKAKAKAKKFTNPQTKQATKASAKKVAFTKTAVKTKIVQKRPVTLVRKKSVSAKTTKSVKPAKTSTSMIQTQPTKRTSIALTAAPKPSRVLKAKVTETGPFSTGLSANRYGYRVGEKVLGDDGREWVVYKHGSNARFKLSKHDTYKDIHTDKVLKPIAPKDLPDYLDDVEMFSQPEHPIVRIHYYLLKMEKYLTNDLKHKGITKKDKEKNQMYLDIIQRTRRICGLSIRYDQKYYFKDYITKMADTNNDLWKQYLTVWM